MSFTSRQRAIGRRAIRKYGSGASSALRLPNTIPTSQLTVDGAILAGATSLTADYPGLEGRIRKGVVFTLAGVSGSYTLAADAEAEGGAVVLTFSPPLAGPVADDALLTFTTYYAEYSFPRQVGRRAQEDQAQIAEGEEVVHLAYVEGNSVPAAGEPLTGVLLDGKPVKKWEPIGEGPQRYRVIREAAA